MNRKPEQKGLLAALLCGMLGCLCFGAGDWLMLYGDTSGAGTVYWLTAGAAAIPAWRNSLAMLLAFPGIILYGIGLFACERFIPDVRPAKQYRTLLQYSLTPWLCLHLFYVMILYLFAWLNGNGYAEAARPAAEALYAHLAWMVPLSEVLMLPPFLYWFLLQITGRTVFPRGMAFTSVLVFYGVLYAVKCLMPEGAFRIGFTNGLMSESMLLWFGAMLLWLIGQGKRKTARCAAR